jgi:hypothetical protein
MQRRSKYYMVKRYMKVNLTSKPMGSGSYHMYPVRTVPIQPMWLAKRDACSRHAATVPDNAMAPPPFKFLTDTLNAKCAV